jgi:hypothetical protein
MGHLLRACGVATATATALATVMPAAIAEEITSIWTCQIVGSGAREPLGDREGHALYVSDYSCYIESGPFAGGNVTGTNVWEWDKADAVLVTGQSISRKAGSERCMKGARGNLPRRWPMARSPAQQVRAEAPTVWSPAVMHH